MVVGLFIPDCSIFLANKISRPVLSNNDAWEKRGIRGDFANYGAPRNFAWSTFITHVDPKGKSYPKFRLASCSASQISRRLFSINRAWEKGGVREDFVDTGAPCNFALSTSIAHVNPKGENPSSFLIGRKN